MNAPGVKNMVSGATGLALHFGNSRSTSVTLCNLFTPPYLGFPPCTEWVIIAGPVSALCRVPYLMFSGVVSLPYILWSPLSWLFKAALGRVSYRLVEMRENSLSEEARARRLMASEIPTCKASQS